MSATWFLNRVALRVPWMRLDRRYGGMLYCSQNVFWSTWSSVSLRLMAHPKGVTGFFLFKRVHPSVECSIQPVILDVEYIDMRAV